MFLLAIATALCSPPEPQTAPVVTRIRVDGRLDDAAWAGAQELGPLRVFEPSGNAQDHEVRVLVTQDERALYFAFEVKSPRKLDTALVPRDETTFQDWVGVALDTFHDGKRAYTFRVNPRGVQADGIYVDGEDYWFLDLSWDDVWDSAGQVTGDGYTVELAIPFRTLRYNAAAEQDWGLIVTHFIPNPWTVTTWPEISRDQASVLPQAAPFHISPPPPRGLRLELNPTLTGSWGGPSTPFVPDPGLSARFALSSGLTADLAVNPDFSQIEADADQVSANTKYPLQYKEKRPFFLEGADYFTTPLDVLYSRSIVDPLAGVKVSGRLGRVGVGVLSAYDQSPAASSIYVDYASGEDLPSWGDATVADADAVASIARARLDVGDGGGIGFIVSDKELMGADGSVLGNHVGGLDGRFLLGEHWVAEGQVLASQTDLPDGSALVGPAWSAALEWGGENYGASLEHYGISPEFRAENGFLEEVGRLGVEGHASRFIRDQGVFRSVELAVDASGSYDFQGAWTGGRVGPRVEGLFGEKLYQQAEFAAIHERYQSRDFERWTFNGYSGITASPHLGISLYWDIGPEPHYDAETAADLYLGFSYLGGTQVSVSMLDRLSVSWDLTAAQFRRSAAGEVVYTTLINRVKTNLNISRPFSFRWIEEWNTFDSQLTSSILAAYQLHPGTAAYIGYSQTSDLAARDTTDRVLFAKVSWLWRV